MGTHTHCFLFFRRFLTVSDCEKKIRDKFFKCMCVSVCRVRCVYCNIGTENSILELNNSHEHETNLREQRQGIEFEKKSI